MYRVSPGTSTSKTVLLRVPHWDPVLDTQGWVTKKRSDSYLSDESFLLVIEYGDFIIITTNFNEGFLCYGIFSEFKFDIVCLCEHAKDTHTNANLDRAKIR